MTTSVGLFNPLPLALAHYQRELTETLAAAGLPALTLDTAGVEVGAYPTGSPSRARSICAPSDVSAAASLPPWSCGRRQGCSSRPCGGAPAATCG